MDKDAVEPTFKERLKKMIGKRDPYPWAESIGISRGTFSGAWKQERMPQTKTLYKIALNTDISLNWLLTGRGPERVPDREDQPVQLESESVYAAPVGDLGESYRVPQNEYVLVPNYSLVTHNGDIIQSEQVLNTLSFNADWIEQTMGLDPQQLALVRVGGDSMEPTLREGDLLLLDRRKQRVQNDAIYVLLRNEDLVAKRLQCGFDGSVTIQSDNAAYATQTLSAENSKHLLVIGQVVWVGRRV